MSPRKHLILFLIVVTVGVSSCYYAEEGLCCPPGYLVRRRLHNPHYCWEPKLNYTVDITLKCKDTFFVHPDEAVSFTVNREGQLIFVIDTHTLKMETDTFCLGNLSTSSDWNFSRAVPLALICMDDEADPSANNLAMRACLIVSTVFLFITAFIYMAIRELRDLLGKSIINMCLSLGIGFSIIAVMNLVTYSSMSVCAVRGFLAYFFVISSFFWTNVISIQLLRSISRPPANNYAWSEFLWYALYAWGSSAVLTISMAIVNFLPGDHPKPGIGLNHCWFFNNNQQWLYMYSVMSILISVNICIFLYVTFTLWSYSFASTHMKTLRFKFNMTIRLFIVMGVPWIFEMIGTLVESHYMWEILDVMNSLQGVLIFLVLVVFRRRTLKMLLRHGWLDCVSGPLERCLAVGEDEEEAVQHTVGLSLDDHNNKYFKSDI